MNSPVRWHSALALLTFISLASLQASAFADSWRDDFRRELKNGGAYVETAAGQELFAFRADDQFIPASTLKIATAACALSKLGAEYRFQTDIFLLGPGVLGIRGYADPNLTSEEIRKIAVAVNAKLPAGTKIRTIVVDTSFFTPKLSLDGYEDSTNPYDAKPTSVAANFNTVFVQRDSKGAVHSAETETPLTPLAVSLGRRISRGTKERVNLGTQPGLAERYFSELLAHFLGTSVTGEDLDIRLQTINGDAKPIYRHLSSKQLIEILPPMFEFSTNFTANELFLLLGAKQFGAPATADKSRQALEECLNEKFQMKHAKIYDGAGLSHRNRVTPREFTKLLRAFRPNRELLRIDGKKFQAKTGSLKGVNTYAGYFDLPSIGEVRFAFFVNDKVEFTHKWRLAEMLAAGLESEKP